MFGRRDFAYNDRADDGSINESLTVKADDQSLYQAMGMTLRSGRNDDRLSFEGAAEYDWWLFIQAMQ
jgi:hypothetical protein